MGNKLTKEEAHRRLREVHDEIKRHPFRMTFEPKDILSYKHLLYDLSYAWSNLIWYCPELTEEERSLANQVIQRFRQAGAPLIMAGVDMLYDHGHPLIGEIEDVVGSRMLYQTSDIDIVALYLDEISNLLRQ